MSISACSRPLLLSLILEARDPTARRDSTGSGRLPAAPLPISTAGSARLAQDEPKPQQRDIEIRLLVSPVYVVDDGGAIETVRRALQLYRAMVVDFRPAAAINFPHRIGYIEFHRRSII